MNKQFVTIRGLAPSNLLGLGDDSDAALQEYISGIVYGTPERIYGVITGTGNFAALVQYDADSGWAKGTFERMGSFSYGSQYTLDVDVAWREFGVAIGHYTGYIEPATV